MPSPLKIFRREPPKEFVERILRSVGLIYGFSDLRWFSSQELALETLEEWIFELEAYYLPCKARRFFVEPVDGGRVIVLLRQILKPHGYGLEAVERVYKDTKQTLYQIQPVAWQMDLSGASLTVDFL
jgi:hypothetical protein